jgi:hypothetical protein
MQPSREGTLDMSLAENVKKLEGENLKLKDQLEEVRKKDKPDSFYADVRTTDLIAFPIGPYHSMNDLDGRELGRLVEAFNNEFRFYNLVVQDFQSNADQGRYKLFAIRRYSEAFRPDEVRDRQIPKEDTIAMRHFLKGFIAGLRSFGRKKKE